MRNIRSYTLTLITLAGFVALAGCGKEVKYTATPIELRVVDNATKAETTTDAVKANGFVLDAWVSDNYRDFVHDPGTELTEKHYINSQGEKNVAGGSLEITGTPYWVSGVKTRFWARCPAEPAGDLTVNDPASPTAESIQFTYNSMSVTDAAQSDDLVFAYAEKDHQNHTPEGGTEDKVNLQFHHAMAKVRFVVNTTDDTYESDLLIQSIKLTGLKKNAKCTFSKPTHDASEDPHPSDCDCFAWSNLTGNGFMELAFNSAVNPSAWSTENDLNVAPAVFFLIPQDLEAGVKATIHFVKGGDETDITVPINDSGAKTAVLHPGRTATFQIKAKNVFPTSNFSPAVSVTTLNVSHENFDDAGSMEF